MFVTVQHVGFLMRVGTMCACVQVQAYVKGCLGVSCVHVSTLG